jgi:fumarate reductase subunit D
MRMARERLGHGVHSLRRSSHDGKVHLVVGKLFQHHFAVVGEKLHRDA